MGKSRRRLNIMRSLLISLVLLVLSVQADDFKGQKVTLGKRKCTCDFRLDMKETCKGTAKCDKKCSGAGKVEVGGCSFALQVKKGNGKISKCTCQAAQPTIGPITGSGSGPAPPTGSGSGPSPPIGSGSGEQPVPLPGSGSGSGPGPQPPAGGEGMQCACKCDCPQGSGECDCDCNCPMNSQAVNCAPGFSKVCPMMGDQCPESMEQVCPSMPTTMPMPAGRMMGAGDRGCQCVPDFLLSLVMGAMTPAGRSAAADRAMTKVTFKIGKTTCKCQYDINEKDCKKSKFACDKKCNGKISGLELDGGNYVMNLMVKKGKVAIQKCEAKTTEPTGTGGGPGSGPGNGGGSGMGSGIGGGMEAWEQGVLVYQWAEDQCLQQDQDQDQCPLQDQDQTLQQDQDLALDHSLLLDQAASVLKSTPPYVELTARPTQTTAKPRAAMYNQPVMANVLASYWNPCA